VADETNDAARRPFYLVIALVTLWLVGMNAASEGLGVIEILKNPFSTLFSLLGSQSLELMRQATASGVAHTSRVALPLGIAQAMLGIMLVAVAFKGLFGRKASVSFALQVIVANAAIAVVGYALRQPIRGSIIDAVVASGLETRPPNMTATEFDRRTRTQWWLQFRVRLGLELAALGFGAIALTRRSARAVLTRPEPSTSEER
jgi:predicted cation transporter